MHAFTQNPLSGPHRAELSRRKELLTLVAQPGVAA